MTLAEKAALDWQRVKLARKLLKLPQPLELKVIASRMGVSAYALRRLLSKHPDPEAQPKPQKREAAAPAARTNEPRFGAMDLRSTGRNVTV